MAPVPPPTQANEAEHRLARRAFWGSMALAFAVRLAHLFALSDTPYFDGLIIDAAGYAQASEHLRRFGEPEDGFYHPPLYVHVRAALEWLGARSARALRLWHAAAGAWVAGLLALTTFHLCRHASAQVRAKATWTSGTVAAVYGPLVAFDVQLLPSVWVHLLLAGALWSCARQTSRRPTRGDVLAGGYLGLATTGWGPACLFAFPCLGLRVSRAEPRFTSDVPAKHPSEPSTAGSRIALLAPIIAAMLLPVGATAAYNLQRGATGVLLSRNLGINLWLGNNPEWRDTWPARPGFDYEHAIRKPERAGAISPGERRAFYVDSVLDDARQRPWAALRRTATKLYYFFHGREIRRNLDLETLRDASPVIWLLQWEAGVFFPFGLLAPIALLPSLGVVERRARNSLLYGTALYALAIAVFFVSSRYRLPAVLLLVPLAAAHGTAWVQRIRTPRSMRLRLTPASRRWLVVAACASVLIQLPNAYTAAFRDSEAERLRFLSRAQRARGEWSQALQAARRAVQIAPDDADAHGDLGELWLHHRPDRALPHFERAAELRPNHAAPLILQAHAEIGLQRFERAATHLEQALQRNPHHPVALRDLGFTYRRLGRYQDAREVFERYQRVGHSSPHVDRALAELKAGDTSR